MPDRIRNRARRTPTQGASDRRAGEVATYLGKALRDARISTRQTQAAVSSNAGVARSIVSDLERGNGESVTLLVWTRVARAAGGDLRAYIEQASATAQPRDAVHLRAQELVVRAARAGGWRARLEAAIDRDPTRSRAADVLLSRSAAAGAEILLVEIWDWLPDVGDAFRSWDRRLAMIDSRAFAFLGPDRIAEAKGLALAVPVTPDTPVDDTIRVGGVWILRATRTNRRLVAEHRAIFRARFPGSGVAWLRALNEAAAPIPRNTALLWITVAGDRLIPARFA